MILVSPQVSAGNYTITLTLFDDHELDPKSAVFEFIIEVKDSLGFEFRGVIEEDDPLYVPPPSLKIKKIDNQGQMEVEFSENFNVYNNLTHINATVLHLEIMPGDELTDKTLLAFNWTVVSFQ